MHISLQLCAALRNRGLEQELVHKIVLACWPAEFLKQLEDIKSGRAVPKQPFLCTLKYMHSFVWSDFVSHPHHTRQTLIAMHLFAIELHCFINAWGQA